MARKAWIEEDLQLVRDEYLTTPVKELAERMGRSVKSVYHMAEYLGVDKPKLVLESEYNHCVIAGEPYYVEKGGRKRPWVAYNCKCGVGNPHHAPIDSLKGGTRKSCGCLNKGKKKKSQTKKPDNVDYSYVGYNFFDKAVVVGPVFYIPHGQARTRAVHAICLYCNKIKEFMLCKLIHDRIQCCGTERAKEARKGKVLSHSPLYDRWRNMMARCHTPGAANYENYGARGIIVCPEWHDFFNFEKWALDNNYSNELSIERIDNMKGYCPENCKWADRIEQANNTRLAPRYEAFGENKTIALWSRDPRCVVGYDAVKRRIKKMGWSCERAITTPYLKPRKVS